MSSALNWWDRACLRIGYKTQAARIREEWWQKECVRRDLAHSKRINQQQARAIMLRYFEDTQ